MENLYGGVSLDSVPVAAQAELAFAQDPQRVEEAGGHVADGASEASSPIGQQRTGRARPNMYKAMGPSAREEAAVAWLLERERHAKRRDPLSRSGVGMWRRSHWSPTTRTPTVRCVAGSRCGRWRGGRGRHFSVLGFPPPVVENMEKFGHDAIADTMRAVR